MKRIAVIGSGISGLAAARELTRSLPHATVTLFEADGHFGGHANTVDLTLDGVTHGVDTGFLVYNERTYPRLIRLLAELEVPTAKSDMSFSVQLPRTGLEWSGSNLASVFAQPSNLLRPAFWRMLRDITRFNRLTTAIAQQPDSLTQSVGDFLDSHGFSEEFRAWYFLPMVACIWSCPTRQMLAFPIATLIRFCHNHGLLQISDRPQWMTVAGGSRNYVARMVAQLRDARRNTPVFGVCSVAGGLQLRTADGPSQFDQVVFACHSDQALQLLGDDASPSERALLGAVRYHANEAVLHTDVSLLPRRKSAWAAWNYESAAGVRAAGPVADAQSDENSVCLHYLLNRLQPLPWQTPVIVSLNPLRQPLEQSVYQRIRYMHPVFDAAAITAQQRLPQIQGQRGRWFCGAWTGYGFHEDGLRAGIDVAAAMLRLAALGRAA